MKKAGKRREKRKEEGNGKKKKMENFPNLGNFQEKR
jgi:hypothetical protein